MFSMNATGFIKALGEEIAKRRKEKPTDRKSVNVLEALLRLQDELTKEKASALTDAPLSNLDVVMHCKPIIPSIDNF